MTDFTHEGEASVHLPAAPSAAQPPAESSEHAAAQREPEPSVVLPAPERTETVVPEAVPEQALQKKKASTPLWLVCGLGVCLLGVIWWGAAEQLDEYEASNLALKEQKTTASALDGAALAGALKQDQAAAKAAPGPMMPPGFDPPQTMQATAQRPASGAYVPPTQHVPALSFAGKECSERPTLEARMKCLDDKWLYQTRKAHLFELGDAMTDDEQQVLQQPARSGQGNAEGAAQTAGPHRPSALDFAREAGLQFNGSGDLFGGGGQGDGAALGQGGRPNSRDAFYQSGGGAAPRREVGRLKKPSTKYWLRAGSILPCALISGINSQLPGQVEAQVTQNVYDSIDHRHLLVPAGSTLVGRPNVNLAEGQSRVQLAWVELHLPNGEFRQLGGMTAADGAGTAGVRGKVNRHWGQKLGLALMSSSINVAFHLATPQPANGFQDAVAQGVGEGVIQTANQGLQKMMRIPDEIHVPPGKTCQAKVERSMTFPRAYRDGKRWRR